jgi:hypothetical protein
MVGLQRDKAHECADPRRLERNGGTPPVGATQGRPALSVGYGPREGPRALSPKSALSSSSAWVVLAQAMGDTGLEGENRGDMRSSQARGRL